jgi:excisionase family DNA binding protein
MRDGKMRNAGSRRATIEGAAAYWGCSSSTIWRAISRGDLPSERVLGRVVVKLAHLKKLPTPRGGGRHRRVSG